MIGLEESAKSRLQIKSKMKRELETCMIWGWAGFKQGLSKDLLLGFVFYMYCIYIKIQILI